MTGLISRGGLSNWVVFFRADELVAVDVGVTPAIRAGIEAGVRRRVGANSTYGPQRNANAEDDEAWLTELQTSAKKVERTQYTKLKSCKIVKTMWSHQLVLEDGERRLSLSLMNRQEAEPVSRLLQERIGANFKVVESGPYAFFARYAPFLVQ